MNNDEILKMINKKDKDGYFLTQSEMVRETIRLSYKNIGIEVERLMRWHGGECRLWDNCSTCYILRELNSICKGKNVN